MSPPRWALLLLVVPTLACMCYGDCPADSAGYNVWMTAEEWAEVAPDGLSGEECYDICSEAYGDSGLWGDGTFCTAIGDSGGRGVECRVDQYCY